MTRKLDNNQAGTKAECRALGKAQSCVGWRTFWWGPGRAWSLPVSFYASNAGLRRGPPRNGPQRWEGLTWDLGIFVDINPHGTLAGAMLSTSRDTQLLALIRLLELIRYSPRDTPTQKRVL